jgi:hypothetical protein
VSNFPSRFHDSHNGRLNLELPISFDRFVGIALFLGCFLELDLIDFDAVEGRCEGLVDGEDVIGADILAF